MRFKWWNSTKLWILNVQNVNLPKIHIDFFLLHLYPVSNIFFFYKINKFCIKDQFLKFALLLVVWLTQGILGNLENSHIFFVWENKYENLGNEMKNKSFIVDAKWKLMHDWLQYFWGLLSKIKPYLY